MTGGRNNNTSITIPGQVQAQGMGMGQAQGKGGDEGSGSGKLSSLHSSILVFRGVSSDDYPLHIIIHSVSQTDIDVDVTPQHD